MSEASAVAAPERPSTRSLASRLAAWFAISAVVLITTAAASLYWTLSSQMRRAEKYLLLDRIRTLRSVLKEDTVPVAEVIEEVEEEWPGGERAHVYVRVLDEAGRQLTQTRGMANRDLPATAFPGASGGKRGTESSKRVREGSGRRFRLYAVKLDVGSSGRRFLDLQLAVDVTGDDALLATYRDWTLVVLASTMAAATWLGFAVAKRGLRPLEKFERTLRHIRSTTLDERLDPSGLPMELSLLATTCNEMLDGLESAFARLARFSADIAHELRTPINNLRGEIEVAIARQRSREEYRAVLESAVEEAQRLSKLIDSLLFLARAEGSEVQTRRESLELRGELLAVAEFYEALASEAGVTLDVEARDHLVANVDRALFQSAVGNLVDNAIAATPRDGRVTIRAEREGAHVRIDVIDTGRGISPTDLPRVFDRLYREDAARSGGRPSGGAGLGLSIVKSIAQLHEGSVSIRSSAGGGTIATLRFPADMTIS